MAICVIQDYRYRTTTKVQRLEVVYIAKGKVPVSLVCNNETIFSDVLEYDRLTQAKFIRQFILDDGLVKCTFSCDRSTLKFNYISKAKPAEVEGAPDIDDRIYFTSLSPPEITVHTLGMGIDLYISMLDDTVYPIVLTIDTNCNNLLVVVCSRLSCRTYIANNKANKVAFVVKYGRTREHLFLDNSSPIIHFKSTVSKALREQLEELAKSTYDSVTKELIEFYSKLVGFKPIKLRIFLSPRIYEVESHPDYVLYRISGIGLYVHLFKPAECIVNSVDLKVDYLATFLDRPDLI